MNTTRMVSRWFARRRKALGRYAAHAEELQMEALLRLVRRAKNTEWGRRGRFDLVKNYEDFAKTSPVNSYEELKADIDRMRRGEKDVLWPGRVHWYAKSSGTTNDKSKFIPISRQNLRDTHYRGAQDTVAVYLGNNPDSRIFSGKALILGGSHASNYNLPHSMVGDLSAVLIEKAGPFVEHYRIPSKQVALLPDFEEKREKIARLAMKADVTNLSGVPSWMLSVLTRMMELSGKKCVREVWPHLEVFFHGGVAFTPYREQYEQLIGNPGMHFMETYNASEGFFGLQTDPADKALSLMIDYGVFFEFIPTDKLGCADAAVPLWGVETGRNYAMVISTSAGLWRYLIGDTVRFTRTNPYKFIITGRTKSFINAFGEELIVDNAEKGIAYACQMTGAQVKDYTAAPVYMDEKGKCRHQWVIEFAKKPDSIDVFARLLDERLRDINSDYEAKRHKDITLQQLEIVVAKTGLFDAWLKGKGKLGGQHKVPRLNNSRQFIDEILALNANLNEKQ